ncbi:MAG: SGNH/GDSL hydrolase family protein, partial [Bacteroidaceae bacterium]|nr:SGNH/GDSL hydrolase family protein [Bacteroidaceae bacterium]
MDKKHFLTLLWLCMASTQLWAVIRVACVGNSITEGVGASSGSMNYPSQMASGLGSGYEVKNFGISGSTMSMSADAPYMTHTRGRYEAALAYKPNIVIIKLGTNDAAFRNWNDKTRSTLK